MCKDNAVQAAVAKGSFKVGDKVRVVRTMYAGPGLQVGAVGTIGEIVQGDPEEADSYMVGVEDYENRWDEDGWFFDEHELELVSAGSAS